jgi:hypothetical protein
MIVPLTTTELGIAQYVANARHEQNLRLGRLPRYGGDNDFKPHLIGCYGELAVAKACNRFWSGSVGNLTAKDVGGEIQVRASTHPRPSLILHPADADNDKFVLVRVDETAVELLGWILGRKGKIANFWRTDTKRPAFFVPVNSLHPL